MFPSKIKEYMQNKHCFKRLC